MTNDAPCADATSIVQATFPDAAKDHDGSWIAGCPHCGHDVTIRCGPGERVCECARGCDLTAISAKLFAALSRLKAPPWTPRAARPFPDAVDPVAYHGLAGDIVRAIEPHSEADPVGLLTQLLVAYGSVAGRHAFYQVEATRHHANMFACLVGDTSKSRKGTAWDHVRRLVTAADANWRVASGLSSGEGVIYQARDATEKTVSDKNTGAERTVTDDPGEADKRLMVLEPEFASVLKVATRDGNIVTAVLRQAWDTGELRVLTRNLPLKATGAHVSVIGHITTGELRRHLNDTEAGNGFANRFLWVCVRRSKELPFGGDIASADFSAINTGLKAALEFGRQDRCLNFDPQAAQLWSTEYGDLSRGSPGLLGAVTSRAEAQAVRLALLYALLACSRTIRREHLEAALALWRFCQRSAEHVFGESLGDPLADALLRAIRNAPDGMSRDDIRQYFQRNQTSAQIERALALLLDQGLARPERRPATGPGRPTEVWSAT